MLYKECNICLLPAQLLVKKLLSSFQPCKATSDDLGRAVSGESILLNEESLERELDIAIEQENYVEAARIRDRIRVLHMDSEASVLAANARFYNAFRIGDLASMQNLWAKGDNVCCVHPGSSGISGYELVMRSWEYVWVDYEFPLEIELRDVQVHVRGEIGYVTCVELVKTKGSSWGRQFATNVFERVDGHWLISVHHASPVDL
uniref:F-box protein SKIP8 n=1 Tax=Chenopodium quinoa TaxID=63459 RepID=A0A803MWU9_CHEQI